MDEEDYTRRLRCARTAREAFQNRNNPVFAQRHSLFWGEFPKPHWSVRLVMMLRRIVNGGGF